MKKMVVLISTIVAGLFVCLVAVKFVGGAEQKPYDVVILGSGPAGLTAGLYTSRANFSTLIVDGDLPGGLLTLTPHIENWPGEVSITGLDLMKKIRKHVETFGCTFLSERVVSVDFSSTPYQLKTNRDKTLLAKSVIIATGVAHRHLNCPGEKEFWGKGVSACATCDAPFYKDREVFVAGGGNSALIEAHHLSRFAKKVTIVHTSAEFHVTDPIKDVVTKTPNISVVHESKIKEIIGDAKGVSGVLLENVKTHEVKEFKTDGVFVAIGFEPNTAMFEKYLELDDHGYIKTDGTTQTSKPGVVVAGDVAHAKYKQAIVAAGDGCRAALDAITYLDLNKK